MMKVKHSFRIVSLFCLSIFFLIAFSSCGRASKREATRGQALLDEADLYMELRELDKAEENAQQALQKFSILVEESPDNVDYRILRVRSRVTLFMAQNFLVIEKAKPLPRSLVRLPEKEELIDYDQTALIAEQELKEILQMPVELTWDQAGFVHGTLAAIYRLNLQTLTLANQQYEEARQIYLKRLQDLKTEKKKVGSNTIAILRLENQIKGLLLAQAEVNLLAEQWETALMLLQQMVAGSDLQYFSLHFQRLEDQISRLEAQLEEQARLDVGSREAKLLAKIQEKKEKKYSLLVELGGLSPQKVELIQSRIQLADLQNNLSYRIICLHNLGKFGQLEEAHSVLRQHYPELDSELQLRLEE